MRRFFRYVHVTSDLVTPLSDLVIFSFCITSSFYQIDAVQGYIKEAVVARVCMCNLIFAFKLYLFI